MPVGFSPDARRDAAQRKVEILTTKLKLIEGELETAENELVEAQKAYESWAQSLTAQAERVREEEEKGAGIIERIRRRRRDKKRRKAKKNGEAQQAEGA